MLVAMSFHLGCVFLAFTQLTHNFRQAATGHSMSNLHFSIQLIYFEVLTLASAQFFFELHSSSHSYGRNE